MYKSFLFQKIGTFQKPVTTLLGWRLSRKKSFELWTRTDPTNEDNLANEGVTSGCLSFSSYTYSTLTWKWAASSHGLAFKPNEFLKCHVRPNWQWLQPPIYSVHQHWGLSCKIWGGSGLVGENVSHHHHRQASWLCWQEAVKNGRGGKVQARPSFLFFLVSSFPNQVILRRKKSFQKHLKRRFLQLRTSSLLIIPSIGFFFLSLSLPPSQNPLRFDGADLINARFAWFSKPKRRRGAKAHYSIVELIETTVESL